MAQQKSLALSEIRTRMSVRRVLHCPIYSPIHMSNTIKDELQNTEHKDSKKLAVSNTNVLFSNSHHSFVVKKSERLASALYVITGFMAPEEPVRSRLRVCALELITRSSNPHDLAESGRELFEYRCGEIATILKTAQFAGLISETNATLLSEEYAELAQFVRTESGRIAERGDVLGKAHMSIPKEPLHSKGHINRSPLENNQDTKRTVRYAQENTSENRIKTILSLFDTKKDISIKDTVDIVPGVSEKTLQRDLLSLVSSGVLEKVGSRRWTTYRRVNGTSSIGEGESSVYQAP